MGNDDYYDNSSGFNRTAAIYFFSSLSGCISLVASIITLWLVWKIKPNGYLRLVGALALTQVAPDVGHILSINNLMATNKAMCESHGFLLLFGNLSTGLWTNAISFSVLYIVMFSRSLNIYNWMPYICIITLAVPLAFSIAALINGDYVFNAEQATSSCFLQTNENVLPLAYSIIHYISFGLNILLYMLIYGFIYRMRQRTGMAGASLFFSELRSSMMSMRSSNVTIASTSTRSPSRRKADAVSILVGLTVTRAL